MADQRRELRHLGILPHNDLILTVAVCAHNLIHIPRPRQIADLTAGIDGIETLSICCIPETNMTIRCAAAGSEQAVLMGRPGDGLDSRRMFLEFHNGRFGGA